jgi:hypothetical protein
MTYVRDFANLAVGHVAFLGIVVLVTILGRVLS